MIIVDIESSGVDPQKNSLLSIGALDFDNPTNQFYEECKIFSGAHVEKQALEVNGFTKAQITDPKKKTDREVVEDFLAWSATCKEHTLAGQNPSFDRDFIQQTCYRYHLNWPFAHRVIDLHSICYFQLLQKGIEPPTANSRTDLNLDKILTYVGLPARQGSHNALDDTKLEAEALSRLINGKLLLKEYEQFPRFPDVKKADTSNGPLSSGGEPDCFVS